MNTPFSRAGPAVLLLLLAPRAPLFAQASLQTLSPRPIGCGVEVVVRLRESRVVLVLHPVSLRADGFTLQVDEGQGPRAVAAPPPTTFRGTIAGRDGTVAASIAGGQVFAVIRTGGATWAIQPQGSAHAVYRSDTVPHAPLRCGSDHGAARPVAGGAPAASAAS